MISLTSSFILTTHETSTIELDEAWVLNFALNNGYTQDELNEMTVLELADELSADMWEIIEQDDTLPVKVKTQIINGDHVGFDVNEVE
jgi:hypothetical protein